MVWSESFDFWWLVPVLMIFFCLFLCFLRRSRAMADCCRGWGGSRDTQRDRRMDDGDDSGRTTDTTVPADEKIQVEKLKSTVERLERRLRSLEEGARPKELEGNRPLRQSGKDLEAR